MATLIRMPWQNPETCRLFSGVPALPPSCAVDVVSGPVSAGAELHQAAWEGFARRFVPLEESGRLNWIWRRREELPIAEARDEGPVPVRSRVFSEALASYAAAMPAIDESGTAGIQDAEELRRAADRYHANDYEAAGALLDGILNRNPDHAEALFYKARIFHEGRNLPAALDSYARAVKLDPTSANSCGYMAVALSQSDRHDEALKLFHRAVDLDPRSSLWCFYLGVEYYGVALTAEARYYLKAAIRLMPYNLAAYRYLADIYEKVEEPIKAMETLRTAVKILPEDTYSRGRIAAICVSLGWYEQAIREYDGLIKIDRAQAAEHYAKRAACYEALGQYERAEGDYRKADALRPGSLTVRVKLAAMPVHLLKIYEDLVSENPRDEVARYELAQTYLKLGGWREAYAQYLELMSIDAAVAARLLDDITARFPAVKRSLDGES